MAVIQGNAHKSSVTGFYPNPIDQSLRFNDDDSAYLSRTPASAGNRKTWTWSGWVKRGNIGSRQIIFSADDNAVNATYFMLEFQSDDNFRALAGSEGGAATLAKETTMVFRDPSAWYHIVFKFDAVNTNAQLYINGQEITSWNNNTNPTNQDYQVNATSQHFLGRFGSSLGTSYLDGYLAEVHFTDGTAYDADAFGEFKEGVWVAKAPSVTYGTNGFYLDFANSADIGNDVSGEGNDWTPNNFTASDVVLDSPTDNFATWNPLIVNGGSVSDGNLVHTTPLAYSGAGVTVSTIALPSSGKFYAEFIQTEAYGGTDAQKHINLLSTPENISTERLRYIGDGTKQVDGTASSYGDSWTVGDVIGVAVNLDDSEVTFYKNGVSQGAISYDPSGYFFGITDGASGQQLTMSANFGQQDFAYTPPTDYLALSTANLPDPAIDPAQGSSPSDYFNTVLYTGDGVNGRSITSVGFDVDFLWIKKRNGSTSHNLHDVIRGAGARLKSDSTDAEASTGSHPSFISDGFTIPSSTAYNALNDTFVAWNWKANGSGVSNTDGSITSTVSANTESGFSIVSYSGNSTSGATIGHGLDSAPEMVVIRPRDAVNNWVVGHKDLSGWNYAVFLNLTNAQDTKLGMFNSTAPTSSVITLGNDSNVNQSNDYICYAFHSVDGFSKFGSYTGNGSADGPFVYLGFKPKFFIAKRTDAIGGWPITDSVRNPTNVVNKYVNAESSGAEATATFFDICSNGIKIRDSAVQNESGGTYVYMAFAENPFKYSNAR